MSWWLRSSMPGLHVCHLAPELVGRDDATLEEALRDRDQPLLVVRRRIVGLRRQRLDVTAPLVDRDADAPAGELHQRVDAPVPFAVLVVVDADRAGGQAAHVVVAAFDHRPESVAKTATAITRTSRASKIHTTMEVRYLMSGVAAMASWYGALNTMRPFFDQKRYRM